MGRETKKKVEKKEDKKLEKELEKELKNDEVTIPEVVSDEKKSSSKETSNTVKISNDAVAMYVGIALEEIQGVYGTVGAFAGITEAISGKKNYTKGVKVDVDESTAKIDVNIIVEYGARIPEVAFEIQTNVKKSVETMTGLKVTEVNVNIQGVHAITDKDEEKEEDNKEEKE